MVAPKTTGPPKEDAKKTTDGKNKKEEVSKRAWNNQCSVHVRISRAFEFEWVIRSAVNH